MTNSTSPRKGRKNKQEAEYILALWRSCRRRRGERNLSFSSADRRIHRYIYTPVRVYRSSFSVYKPSTPSTRSVSHFAALVHPGSTVSRLYPTPSRCPPRHRFREYRSTFSRTVLSGRTKGEGTREKRAATSCTQQGRLKVGFID